MKRKLFYIFIFFGAACSFYKADMPSFNLLLIDSTTIFNTRDIPKGKPSVLLFFDPDCEHCQEETTDLLKNMDSLSNINFYFISINQMDRLKVFNGYYQLSRYPNITVGKDYSFFFLGHFKDVYPPYSIVYDRHKRLRAVFKGEATAKQIILIVNNL